VRLSHEFLNGFPLSVEHVERKPSERTAAGEIIYLPAASRIFRRQEADVLDFFR
jgi:hypothetical protein